MIEKSNGLSISISTTAIEESTLCFHVVNCCHADGDHEEVCAHTILKSTSPLLVVDTSQA